MYTLWSRFFFFFFPVSDFFKFQIFSGFLPWNSLLWELFSDTSDLVSCTENSVNFWTSNDSLGYFCYWLTLYSNPNTHWYNYQNSDATTSMWEIQLFKSSCTKIVMLPPLLRNLAFQGSASYHYSDYLQ